MREDKEELLDELEKKNKILMAATWILTLIIVVFYLGIIFLAGDVLGEGEKFSIIMIAATTVFIIGVFYALYFEIQAGYYECRKCKHKFVPKYIDALFATHFGTTRHLRCPECGEKSWCKKVFKK